MKFRIKLTLKDGRKIYPTRRDDYQLVEGDALESKLIRDLIAQGAYTKSLSMFVAGANGDDFVGISHGELEPSDSPIDCDAFILGGAKAE